MVYIVTMKTWLVLLLPANVLGLPMAEGASNASMLRAAIGCLQGVMVGAVVAGLALFAPRYLIIHR